MYPYRIRLRGPWEAESLEPPGEVRRVTMPARFGECGLGGCRRVWLRRRFGRPRRIDAHERVWLIGEGLTGRAEFHLNAHFIGNYSDEPPSLGSGGFAFPVTDLIAERNELAIDIAAADPDAGLWGDVALEIRCAAYLTDVSARRVEGGRLCIIGELCDEADRPLEIYVLADNKTVAYQVCNGGRFEMITDELADRASEIRVELVNGAAVWYVMPLSR